MNEEFEHLWGKLSLTVEEQNEIIIKKDWLKDGEKADKRCLIGRIILNRRVNVEAMKNVLCTIRKKFSV